MKGIRLPEGSYNGTIPTMLSAVGFKVKTLVKSGDTEEESIRLIGGTVLGYGWKPKEDLMSVKIRFNTSKKRKGIRTGDDLDLEKLEEFKSKPTTRKVLMGFTNSVYDPLGIAAPFTIKLKITEIS